MYGDRVGARIGLLYYCFLSATMVVLLRENNFEGCWGSALETSETLCTQLRFTCHGGAGNSKFSIQALIKQEPLTPPKVASVHNCFSTGGGLGSNELSDNFRFLGDLQRHNRLSAGSSEALELPGIPGPAWKHT